MSSWILHRTQRVRRVRRCEVVRRCEGAVRGACRRRSCGAAKAGCRTAVRAFVRQRPSQEPIRNNSAILAVLFLSGSSLRRSAPTARPGAAGAQAANSGLDDGVIGRHREQVRRLLDPADVRQLELDDSGAWIRVA